MKMKIKKIEKDGRYLNIYIKIPFYATFNTMYNKIKFYGYLDEESSLPPYIDITGKYIVLVYILRNKENILPYIVEGCYESL